MTDTETWEHSPDAGVDADDAERLATTPDTTDRREAGREQLFRRAFTLLLVLFLLGGALRAYGVLARDATARSAAYELDVRYGRITRAGLATPFDITVRSRGGPFSEPVRVAVSSEYLAMFDQNGLDPDPAAATADDRMVVWEFDPPPGAVLRISLDARVEPAVQWGRGGSVAVLSADDRPVVSVDFHTWVLP